MSQLDSILGMSQLAIIRSEIRGSTVHVWAKPKRIQVCVHCHQRTLRIKATYCRTLKNSRQGNRLVFLHLSTPKYHCKNCDRYFRHPVQGVRARQRATDTFKLEVFEAHHGGVSQRQLSTTHQLGSATVQRWYQQFIKQRIAELSGRSCPQILGIDEHFFSRKKGYATTFVDLKNHKVFDVTLGRSKIALAPYLQRLPGKENVKVVVMDLSETYRNIVKHHFPNAKIVTDRFHVVRLVNQHLLSLWKQQDELGRKNRGLISLMRRHQWKLRPDQQLKLQEYLNQYPVLDALYHAKQQLVKLLRLKNQRPSQAKKQARQLLVLIKQFMNSPAQAMAKTLLSWIEPIVRM